MGTLKDQALETEDVKTHDLTEPEMNYVKLLNLALQFHTMGQRIISGYLYYVSTTRLGYKEGTNLQFELDINAGDNKLTVKLLPENFGQAPAPGTEAPAV